VFIYGQLSRDGTGLLYACLSRPITVQESGVEQVGVGTGLDQELGVVISCWNKVVDVLAKVEPSAGLDAGWELYACFFCKLVSEEVARSGFHPILTSPNRPETMIGGVEIPNLSR
jgi:hypothetical protein